MATTDYIFSINTGRSGSDYLHKIFKHVSGCRSFHEPTPVGNKRPMRLYARGDRAPMKMLAKEKIRIMQEVKRDCRSYFESNHCFIKGFGWFLPEDIPENKLGVIILKRDSGKIAESYLRIGYSPLNAYGRDWIITPDMKKPLVKPPTAQATYHLARVIKKLFFVINNRRSKGSVKKTDPGWLVNYERKCLEWYVEETHAKGELFKEQFPGINYYETTVEELNSIDSVRRMLAHFGCIEEETLTNVVGCPTNLKRPQSIGLVPANHSD